MDKKVLDHIRAIKERLLERWPDMADRLERIGRTGPGGWSDMLDECDLLLHEEKKNAVNHDRLHAHEILEIEHAIEGWEATNKLERFSVYVYLLWLKKKHRFDRAVEVTLHDVLTHAEQSLPPTSP